MSDELRKILAPIGVLCVVAAVVGGRVKIAGSEVPVISSAWQQVVIGGVGLVLLVCALWRRRPRMVTYELTAPTSAIGRVTGTIENPVVKTSRFGGGIRRIKAAGYHRGDDGSYIFTDRGGQVVEQIPRHQVHTIRRVDAPAELEPGDS